MLTKQLKFLSEFVVHNVRFWVLQKTLVEVLFYWRDANLITRFFEELVIHNVRFRKSAHNFWDGCSVRVSPDVVRLSGRLRSGDKLCPVAGEILKKLDRPPDRTGRPACPAGRGQGTLSGRLIILITWSFKPTRQLGTHNRSTFLA